jgi:hypothetical protein
MGSRGQERHPKGKYIGIRDLKVLEKNVFSTKGISSSQYCVRKQVKKGNVEDPIGR